MKDSTKRDIVAEWSWGVLALICGVFVVIAAAAALKQSWVAVAMALLGLGFYAASAWRKYKALRTGVLPTKIPASEATNEARAGAINARVLFLVGALGLLMPLYLLGTSGKLKPSGMADLWPVFIALWLVGVMVACFVVYIFRYLANPDAKGNSEKRSD
jgi:MFS family permease